MISGRCPHSPCVNCFYQFAQGFFNGVAMSFKYTVKAHPTMYRGVQYRSRLEARWAAFFDLAGWQHEYEPIDLPGWSPDFRVEFLCGHSGCEKTEGKRDGSHVLLVEVKPYFHLEQFKGHASGHYAGCGLGKNWTPELCCSAARFGANPEVTHWIMSHGSGGGDEHLIDWVPNHDTLWRQAGNVVQWKPQGNTSEPRPTGRFSAIIWDSKNR